MNIFKKVNLFALIVLVTAISQSAWANPPVPLWLKPPVDVSAGEMDVYPHISMSADGAKATAVWNRKVDDDNQVWALMSASATIVGNTATWGDAAELARSYTLVLISGVEISADGSKALVVMEGLDSNGTTFIYATTGTINGNNAAWIPGSVIARNSDPNVGGFGGFSFAFSSDGNKATVVWALPEVNFNGTYLIQTISANISGASISWGDIKDLATDVSSYLAVEMSDDGSKATILWSRITPESDKDTLPDNKFIKTSSATIVGNVASWSTVNPLAIEGVPSQSLVSLALSADGSKAIAIWTNDEFKIIGDDISMTGIIQTSSASISGNIASWSPVKNLSFLTNGYFIDAPNIEVSSDGMRATAMWLLRDRNYAPQNKLQTISTSISGDNLMWGSVNDMVSGEDISGAQLGLSADGRNATALWTKSDDGINGVLQTASANISGNTSVWSEAIDLSETGVGFFSGASLGLSADGSKATALWNTKDFIIKNSSATISTPKMLMVNKVGNGSVASTPSGIDCGDVCSASFQIGTSVTLTATPTEDTKFGGWTGPCTGNSVCVIDMNEEKSVTATFIPLYDPSQPYVKTKIPFNQAIVKQPFLIGWELNMVKKGRPVRVKFSKDNGSYRVLKSTTANAAGVGSYIWKPTKAQRTNNGQIQVCAVPSKGAAEVCSPSTSITVQ